MNKRAGVISVILVMIFVLTSCSRREKDGDGEAKYTIKVGVLHSLTGTMAISERAVVDATLFAINELNKHGGLLGRRVKPILADGKSDPKIFAFEAERLIIEENVSAVFGCWTSASRKAVKPLFERHGHLLFYPVQHEGLESSPNIVYLGATPSQQIIPAVRWCLENIGKRVFLAGSDYIFTCIANIIIRDYVIASGGEIVGEDHILLGSTDVDQTVEKILNTKPDIIMKTINGDTNISFFSKLRKAGITSGNIPTMSFSISESELEAIGLEYVVNDYACWNYFQSIESETNMKFVENFKAAYGLDRVISDPMEAAYIRVHMWADSVRAAKTWDTQVIKDSLKNLSVFNAPEGHVHYEPFNGHLLKKVRIGKIRDDGQFEIVWASDSMVRPRPYLYYRSRDEWDRIVLGFYNLWGGSWEAGNN
ncbi:MAG: ABC transporter substrate-binding protein [Planctomycetes bacterium]|nr:ABC transporter substrate-binding protein [Planctomycetota bacterium]